MITKTRPKEPIQVSVIVVTYNSACCIKSCLDSLLRTALTKFEVLVLDNGSDDETVAIASKYEGIRLLPLGKNLGLAKARNIGVRLARGSYLAFVDHDTIVDPMWLTLGIEELRKRPVAGPLQFRVLSQCNPRLISTAGKGAHNITLDRFPNESFSGVRSILYPIGAGFVLPRDVFERIGGFDDNFFVGDDDIDFGWRGWLLGFPSVCISTGTVYHDGGGFRRGKSGRIFQYFGARNLLCMYIQNLSGTLLLSNLPIIVLWYPLHVLLHGRLEGLRGLYNVLLPELRKIYLKRLRIQNSRVIKDDELMPYISYELPTKQFSRDLAIVLTYMLRSTVGRLSAELRINRPK